MVQDPKLDETCCNLLHITRHHYNDLRRFTDICQIRVIFKIYILTCIIKHHTTQCMACVTYFHVVLYSIDHHHLTRCRQPPVFRSMFVIFMIKTHCIPQLKVLVLFFMPFLIPNIYDVEDKVDAIFYFRPYYQINRQKPECHLNLDV